MIHLKRYGYGSYFNDIYYDSDKLIKRIKHDYGINKLKNEILFYNYIKDTKCSFPIPLIYSSSSIELSMKYYPDHIPLYKIYNLLTENEKVIVKRQISDNLQKLHTSSVKPVSKDIYINDIKIETRYKIIERFKEIKPIIDLYKITSVNNINLCSFDDILNLIETKINYYVSLKSNYEYVPIHGDCQFSNILYNKDSHDMIFIDPRGYFGQSSIFGIAEYDISKVMFALTGYDIFDNMYIEDLYTENNNLTIKDFQLESNILNVESFTRYLVLSIWLGNAHCFKDFPVKAAYSYYYAIYLGTLVYNDVMSGTK